MVFLGSIRVLAIVVLFDAITGFQARKMKKESETCEKLSASPYFEPDLVIEKSWRIYYSWNMKLEDKCLDMIFVNSTPTIVARIYNDMYEYLDAQPFWDAATLLVTMGQSRHEMLLFADQGSAGNFVGVPNVVKDGNISPNKNMVPLLKIHLKLLEEGKYLIMSDCNIGVSTMSVRRDMVYTRQEIEDVATSQGIGNGIPACVKDILPTAAETNSTIV